MRQRRLTTVVLALGVAATMACSSASTNQARSVQAESSARLVGGCRMFPANNYWHADIRQLPVHDRSAAWLSHMSTGVDLHPDFGPSYGDGPNYGMPITYVTDAHPKVSVRFRYASESDRVRYPFGNDTKIEGGRNAGGDMHAIVVNKSTCRLYETWATRVSDNVWSAGSGATWSLSSNKLRPDGWTSADAAGLPILPGLLRWAEVKAGLVNHAIRFTTDVTSDHHLWPARHHAGSTTNWNYPPMGARFRLKASFPTTGFGPGARTVIAAMKKYGLVLADNGSPWFFQGERNSGWPESLIEQLKTIPASQFVAVDASVLKVSSDSAATAGLSLRRR